MYNATVTQKKKKEEINQIKNNFKFSQIKCIYACIFGNCNFLMNAWQAVG